MTDFKFIDKDPYLKPYKSIIQKRKEISSKKVNELVAESGRLTDFANGHHYFGRQKTRDFWIFREWAPNATGIQLIGDRIGWTNRLPAYSFTSVSPEIWELKVPLNQLIHKDLYKLNVSWSGGEDVRLSPWTKRVVQDPKTKLFCEQVWDPKEQYHWINQSVDLFSTKPLLIYEAHIGMSSEKEGISSYDQFRRNILPYIADIGYNVIQLMAVQEHPYYGSFGYHVSNFFAAASWFGTPEELKELIDGIGIIMDLVHSHSVKNVLEGPGMFDGKPGMFFHSGERRNHPAWDSLCFDYGRNETIHFLLSNCKFWLEEYKFDGFRFDGVTSMLYYDHGLERSFSSYDDYFDAGVDIDAVTYLDLANQLIKEVAPKSVVIAEEMSGMPGLAVANKEGGIGFDYRLAMGIPDFWIKLIKEKKDEEWSVNEIFFELTNKRADEKVISYAESHDQALVGDKTIIFRLADKEMYSSMSVNTPSLIVDRAIALHKMIRLITLCTHGGGYLNFIGNEFGHPEWIDFPREGNEWSFKYARRQWSLVKNQELRYQQLKKFDDQIIDLFKNENNLANAIPELRLANETDQVLAIQRADYIFIFNFNPNISFPDYGIPSEPSDYQTIFDSDESIYGGFDRIKNDFVFESYPIGDSLTNYQLLTYLPNRTVQVVKAVPTPKIR